MVCQKFADRVGGALARPLGRAQLFTPQINEPYLTVGLVPRFEQTTDHRRDLKLLSRRACLKATVLIKTTRRSVAQTALFKSSCSKR